MRANTRKIVGSREKVSFPDLITSKFLARVDTGAKTSSIHCEQYWFEKENGRKVLYTKILGIKKVFRFSQYNTRIVKSSNGQAESRFVINLSMKMGEEIYQVDFTLTNRGKMKNPVLLGRRFLRHGFLVNPGRNFLLSGKKKKSR
jgi:hypothetical protein